MNNPGNAAQNILRIVVVILIAAVSVFACGWYLVTERSVRFNSFRTGRAFYRLPPLPIMYDKDTGRQYSVMDMGESSDTVWEEPSSEPVERPDEKAWEQVRTAIDGQNLDLARTLLQDFVKLTEPPMNVNEDEKTAIQSRRNVAFDILDAMSALRQGSSKKAVAEYVNARLATDAELPEPAIDDRNLRDNWDYLRAAKLYVSKDTEGAREAFEEHARKYPNSEKNEAAMYMLAKISMESSHSFENTACGIQGKGEWGKPIDPAKIEDPEKCRDESWQSAVKTFQQLMRTYPNGRYFDDSRGWLAYLYRRGSNRAEALAEYYRMLSHPTSWAVRIEAKKSLQILGHEYDDETLDQVEKLIADDVDASMAYAYHRIYNHAIDLTYMERDSSWQCWHDDSPNDSDGECVAKANKAGTHELERVARFATAMMKRHPRANVSGGFVVRVAEAQLELQNYKESVELAKKALALGAEGALRTEALWVKGSSEHQLKNLSAARKSLEQLVSEFPKSNHVEGARRLLAMIAEDRGDFESALEYYIALDYEYDVAYFVDVYLPIDRLAKFIAQRPTVANRDQLLYALGVRYMRDQRWNEARETLRQVKTDATPVTIPDEETNPFVKEFGWGWDEPRTVRAEWVLQDLRTIDVLENFERVIAASTDDESKAESMYQLASFYYESDDLLLYNPQAWRGLRSELLNTLQFDNHIRLPDELQVIFEHEESHERWARAIPIYLEIVDRFPNTRAAKDALYSAAVAHERLSNMNEFWRGAYRRGMFAGPRDVSYADVKSAYPHYQFPRGTNGWQPSSRTVNGGPGWAAPEKPVARETKEHRIKRLLREGAATVSDYANKVLPKVENKVEGGIDWYKSAIEAAAYGIVSGIGLWFLVLIGIGLHSRRNLPDSITKIDEPASADSRVDKFLSDHPLR